MVVALGSNEGDSVAQVEKAFDDLEALAGGDLLRSSLWRTQPVDCPPGAADFINAAAAFVAPDALTPERLLYDLKRLERAAGRVEGTRNAPRPLDLDLLVFGDERRSLPWFHLPHPRATTRRFVLAPAAEIVPHLCWPGTERTVVELLARLDADDAKDDAWAQRLQREPSP